MLDLIRKKSTAKTKFPDLYYVIISSTVLILFILSSFGSEDKKESLDELTVKK